jgi:hypothetical protein
MKLSHANLVVAGSAAALMAVIASCPETKQPAGPADPAATTDAEVRSVRVCVKLRLARDVAAGRLSLWEAAALFGALNRQQPPPVLVVEPNSSVPAAELLCSEVIKLVDFVLLEHPAEQTATVAQLEAELRWAQDQPGGVWLSEPSAAQVGELLTQARDRLGLGYKP